LPALLTTTSMCPNRSTAGLDGRFGVGGIGHVELHGQEVVVLANGRGDVVGVAGGGDHGVASGERRLGDVDAHAPTGAGDKPDLLLSHANALPSLEQRMGHRVIGGAGSTQSASGQKRETLR
jgi:hypothetical protein